MRAPWLLLSLAALQACTSTPAAPDASTEWDVPLGGDGGGVDIPVAPIDIVRVDAPGTDAPGADAAPFDDVTAAADAGPAVRSCRTVFTYNLGRSARAVTVAGEWNQFSPTTNPMTDTNGAGSYRLELELPPGDYGYKFVVDGTQWDLDPGRIARKYVGAVENSRVVVTDCNTPELRVLRQRATADGTLELDVQYVSGGDRSEADPAARRVVMNGAELPAGALTWDATARVMRVRLAGLARDRYTFRVNARSQSGRSAEELIVPMWVEETPYQWGDGSLYFVFTDRFRNGDPTNDGRTAARRSSPTGTAEISRASPRRSTRATSTRWACARCGSRRSTATPAMLGRGSDNRQLHGLPRVLGQPPAGHRLALGHPRRAPRAHPPRPHRHGIRVLYDLVNNQLHREHPYFMEPARGVVQRRRVLRVRRPMLLVGRARPRLLVHLVPARRELDQHGHGRPDGGRRVVVAHGDRRRRLPRRRREAHGLHSRRRTSATGSTAGRTATRDVHRGRDLRGQQRRRPAAHPAATSATTRCTRSSTSRCTGPSLEAFARNGGGMMDLENTVRANESAYGQFPMSPFLGNHDVSAFSPRPRGRSSATPRTSGTTTPRRPRPRRVPYARLRLAWTFILTQRGVPLIYYGDEIGLPGAADPDNRRPMRFGNDVNGARAAPCSPTCAPSGSSARATAGSSAARGPSLHADGDGYVYARGAGADLAVVALNRGTTARAVSVAVPGALGAPDGTVLRDALSTATVTVRDGRVEVPFTARGSSVFVR
jgi:hypothetical protein